MFSESSEEIEPESAMAESSWLHRFTSASASATSSTPPPTTVEAILVRNYEEMELRNLEGMYPHGFHSKITCQRVLSHHNHTATTTVTDAPLALHNAMDNLIAKHPKVLSTVSTVLTTVGGIILFPGVAACASGTILAHPAVTIAGGIAVILSRRLRCALNSATALAATQVQASGQVNIKAVDDHQRDRTEPNGLLSVDFIV